MPMICDFQLFLFHGGMVFSMGGFFLGLRAFFLVPKPKKKKRGNPKRYGVFVESPKKKDSQNVKISVSGFFCTCFSFMKGSQLGRIEENGRFTCHCDFFGFLKNNSNLIL